MKQIISSILFLGIIFAKDGKNKDNNPCNHPLIRLAESKGLKAVPLKDMIKLRKLIEKCEKSGGKNQIKKLYENDLKRDYKKAKSMASWTSTHAMVVLVSFGYYFAGKVLATKPESSN